MPSKLCKSCVHTKVCMLDKNLVGDVFVMGNPDFFDNEKLYEEYKKREEDGFPCNEYLTADVKPVVRCKDCKCYEGGWYCSAWNNSPGFPMVTEEGYCNLAERRTDEIDRC